MVGLKCPYHANCNELRSWFWLRPLNVQMHSAVSITRFLFILSWRLVLVYRPFLSNLEFKKKKRYWPFFSALLSFFLVLVLISMPSSLGHFLVLRWCGLDYRVSVQLYGMVTKWSHLLLFHSPVGLWERLKLLVTLGPLTSLDWFAAGVGGEMVGVMKGVDLFEE